MKLEEVSQPTEFLSLADAKLHLRVDDEATSPPSHPDDALITALIATARQYTEKRTGKAIGKRTFKLTLDTLAAIQPLYVGPVHSITSVKYDDTAGAEQTIDPADYSLSDGPYPVLWLRSLPATRGGYPGTVRITFEAGYTAGQSPNTAPLPYPLEAAVKLLLGHLYETRQAALETQVQEVPLGYENLVWPFCEGAKL